MQLSLRPATEEDLSAVERIERQVHLAPWSHVQFEAELKKPYSHFLVLTDDETDSIVVGYLVYWILMEACHILNVAVDVPYRRRGYAKSMLRQVIHLAFKSGIKKVLLDVRKSSLPAIQLYQGLGFSISSVQKGFYSNGEDAYQMLLVFSDSPQF